MNHGQAKQKNVLEVLEPSQKCLIEIPKQLQSAKNCVFKMEEIFESSRILQKIWMWKMDGKKMVVATLIPLMDALGGVEQQLFHERLAYI